MKQTFPWGRVIGGVLFLLLAALVFARLQLNTWLENYVNRTLAGIPGYEGSVESIDIDLYRGAYRIHKLSVYKTSSHIPTPFISIDMVDFSIQWSALFHGRIVSNAELVRPIINFAVNPAGTAEQTGAGVDWSKPIKGLMPIDINRVVLTDGKISYRDFSTTPQVNIYIHHLHGEARNLRNVVDMKEPLPSTIAIRGNSIGKGVAEIRGRLNILRPIPDMDLDIKLEHVRLQALSDYSNAYAAIDIREGNLNMYSEFIIKNNQISGYIKPIATNVQLIDLRKPTNPIKLVWELLVAAVVEIFTNQPKDQFATKIPLDGKLHDVDTDTWSAVAGIVRNAFIKAFKSSFDNNVEFNQP